MAEIWFALLGGTTKVSKNDSRISRGSLGPERRYFTVEGPVRVCKIPCIKIGTGLEEYIGGFDIAMKDQRPFTAFTGDGGIPMITMEDAVVDILQGTCEGVEDVPNEGLGDKLPLLFLLLLLWSVGVPFFVMREIPHDEVLNGAKLTVLGKETNLIEKTTFCDIGIDKANDVGVVENLEKENLSSQPFIICWDFLQNAASSGIFVFDEVDAFVLSALATTPAWI